MYRVKGCAPLAGKRHVLSINNDPLFFYSTGASAHAARDLSNGIQATAVYIVWYVHSSRLLIGANSHGVTARPSVTTNLLPCTE